MSPLRFVMHIAHPTATSQMQELAPSWASLVAFGGHISSPRVIVK